MTQESFGLSTSEFAYFFDRLIGEFGFVTYLLATAPRPFCMNVFLNPNVRFVYWIGALWFFILGCTFTINTSRAATRDTTPVFATQCFCGRAVVDARRIELAVTGHVLDDTG